MRDDARDRIRSARRLLGPALAKLPEFGELCRKEQRQVWLAALRRTCSRPLTWVVMVACLAPFVPVTVAVKRLIQQSSWDVWPLTGMAAGGLGGVVSGVLLITFLRPLIARQVAAEMPGHCRTCGYDLRGSQRGDCPECGTRDAAAGTR